MKLNRNCLDVPALQKIIHIFPLQIIFPLQNRDQFKSQLQEYSLFELAEHFHFQPNKAKFICNYTFLFASFSDFYVKNR